jgi:carbonic anhydrase/acetyltransferase-like protein (isoleucine patch superfamily)
MSSRRRQSAELVLALPTRVADMPIHRLDGIAPDLPPDGTYWIAPTATVIGKVKLSEGVGIWFGAVVRGDGEPIIVGSDSNLQENAVIHTDPGFPATVGTGCTVGHRAILHGCTLGDNVLIGMGAIVLNGARVGDNALIGAGALVPEGKEIPPGSLVLGMPGKVVRQLTADEIARNRDSAIHYVANWKRFAKGLAPR